MGTRVPGRGQRGFSAQTVHDQQCGESEVLLAFLFLAANGQGRMVNGSWLTLGTTMGGNVTEGRDGKRAVTAVTAVIFASLPTGA